MAKRQSAATILNTLELLEWLIVCCPFLFWAGRYWEADWMQPEYICIAQLSLVIMLAIREKTRGTGDALRKERALEEKKMGTPVKSGGVGQAMWNFAFSTKCGTDRHKPEKTALKGLSCWFFAVPAIDILFFFNGEMYDLNQHEVAMLLSQCCFSFMADHVMVPNASIWHPADRWSALALTTYGFIKPSIRPDLTLLDSVSSYAAVASSCIYFSMIARRHHGLPTHHIHHSLFHLVVASSWSYCNFAPLYAP